MRSAVLLLAWLRLTSVAAAEGPARLVVDTGAHHAKVQRVLFTSDSKLLISLGNDKTIRVLEIASGRTLRVLHMPSGTRSGTRWEGALYAAALSPDDRILAVAGYGYPPDRHGWIYLFDLAKGRVVRILRGFNWSILALTFSPDGTRLASANFGGRIEVWDPHTGELKRKLFANPSNTRDLAYSPDSQLLATAGDEPTARIWIAGVSRQWGSLWEPLARPEAVALISSGQPTPGGSGVAQVPWRALWLAQFPPANPNRFRAIRWGLDGKTIATGGPDGAIRIYTPANKLLRRIDLPYGAIKSLHYKPNGKTLVAACDNGTCAEVDLATGGVTSFDAAPGQWLGSAMLSRDGKLLAAGDVIGNVYIWELSTRKKLHAYSPVVLTSLAWSEDGATIRWAEGSTPTTYFSLREMRLVSRVATGVVTTRTQWGRSSVSRKDETTLTLKDERGERPLPKPSGNEAIRHFCHSGDFIVAATDDYLHVLDTRQSYYYWQWLGKNEGVGSLAASPDGRFLLTSRSNRLLDIWDLRKSPKGSHRRSEPLLTIFGSKDGAAWASDGYHATWGAGSRTLRWQTDTSPDDAIPVPLENEASKRLSRRMHRPNLVRSLFSQDQTPLSQADILEWVHDDLEQAKPQDRRHYRYVSFVHQAAAGLGESQRQDNANALAFLLNSLSWSSQLHRPAVLDPGRSLYRIDLRHYAWDADLWHRLLEKYPYGFQRPGDPVAGQVSRWTETPLAWVRGDWLLFAAFRPPLYHDLLRLPDTEQELERMLGVDVRANLSNGVAVRCAFGKSEVSKNNRLLERHQGRYGYYWKSHDFGSNTGRQNLLAHPLSFQRDGGEAVFQLPNGLQAYLLTNAAGDRIDVAPSHIVVDNRGTLPGKVINGVSCMRCHDIGMMPSPLAKTDEVRPLATREPTGFTPVEREAILTQYRPVEEFNAFLREDSESFLNALTRLGILTGSVYQCSNRIADYEARLDLAEASAELGVPAAKLLAMLSHSRALPLELGPLGAEGGQVVRSVFEGAFADVVRELELGEPFRWKQSVAPLSPAVVRAAPPADPPSTGQAPAGSYAWPIPGIIVAVVVTAGLAAFYFLRRPAARIVLIGAVLASGLGATALAQNKGDDPIAEQLRRAQEAYSRRDFHEAVDALTPLLRRSPDNPEALLLRARVRMDLCDLNGASADVDQLFARDAWRADALRARARLLHLKREDFRALAELDRLLKKAPKDGPALALRSAVWLNRDDCGRAEADARAAVMLDPALALAYECLGRALLEKGLREEAREAFDAALRLEPGRASARYYRALTWPPGQEAASRKADLAEILKLRPRYAADFYWRAQGCLRQGQLDRAVACLTMAIGSQTGWQAPYVLRANVYRAKGAYDEALTDLSTAIRLSPELSLPLTIEQAALYQRKGDDVKALRVLQDQLAKRPPRDAKDHRDRAYALIEQRAFQGPASGAYEQALQECNHALQLHPGFTPALIERGYIHHQRQEWKFAEADLQNALVGAPLHNSARYYLSDLWQHRNEPKRALAILDDAIDNDDRDDGAYSRRAAIKADGNDHAGAVADYTQAILIKPGRANLYNFRGVIHQRAGQFEEALADYSEAARRSPTVALYQLNRGICLLRMDRPSSAVSALIEALRGDPGDETAYEQMAEAHTRLDEHDRAKEIRARLDSMRLTKARARVTAGTLFQIGFPGFAGRLQAASFLAAAREMQVYPAAALMDQRSPDRPDRTAAVAFVQRAQAFYRQHNAGAALNNLDEASRLDPTYAEAWVVRGQIAMDKRQSIDAMAQFEKAIALEPKLSTAWRLRGLVEVELGRYGDAISSLTKAVELRPQPPQSYQMRALAHSKQGNYMAAVADYGEQIRLLETQSLDPTIAPALAAAWAHLSMTDLYMAYYRRAENHRLLGKGNLAVKDFTTSIALYPRHRLAFLNRGQIYLSQKKSKLAIDDASRVIELAPRDRDGFILRASGYRQAGQTKLAEADEKKVRELTPSPIRIVPGPLLTPPPPREE